MSQPVLGWMTGPLLAWYDANARSLPWRDDPAPYRVFVSEIMLQQTRVETVKPYFERFVAELPDFDALANVPEERLLKLWEGLGYYSRAKNLRRAAQIVVSRFGGGLPADFETLKELPGVGDYTAGAVASIAFGIPVPAVDGNVLRVAARLTAGCGSIADPAVKKETARLLQEVIPADRAGDYNQAMMELGATVCLPRAALRCAACPLPEGCEGFRRGIAANLPVRPAKKERRIEHRTVFVITCGEVVALLKRPAGGLLPGLWEFPNTEETLSPDQARRFLQSQGIEAETVTPIRPAKHVFSHIEWHMTGYRVAAQAGSLASEAFVWVGIGDLFENLSLPSAFRAFKSCLKPDGKTD